MSKDKFLGIGIGLSGVIDFKNGTIKILTRFPEWKEVPLKEILKRRMKMPVVIDNEVNVRALGEKWFDLGINVKNFITINTTENGIGAGIVVNNELLRGNNYLCGEIGYMLTRKLDIIDDSGNSENLESLLNVNNINLIIRKNINKKNNWIFKDFSEKNNAPLDKIFEVLNNNFNDETVSMIVDEIASIFALGIANVVCTFDPELIIIQGKFSKLGDYFYNRVRNIVEKKVFPLVDKNVNTERSSISKEMGIMGSASMVLDVINI